MTETREAVGIWTPSGNPFADAGAEVMAALASVDSPEELTLEDVRPLLSRLAKLYAQDDWRKDLSRVFPNAAMTNPAFRGKEETVYRTKLEGWFGQLVGDESLGTTCLVSGREAQTHVDKSYLPLSGSVGGNFQSGTQRGWPVSAAVALSLQFAPLAMVRVGGMWALPHFSADELQATWADERKRHVLSVEAVGKGGIEVAATKRRVNAFFRLIEDLVREHRDAPDSTVTLYLFNNHNQANH